MVDKQTIVSTDTEILLVEYQAAQESAHHHDNLTWSVTTVLLSASLVLFGFVLGSLDKHSLRLILMSLSILGIALTIAVWRFALQFNFVMRQKYDRCKEIEAKLKMKQHLKLKYPVGQQRAVYALLMTLFLTVWLIVLWMAWSLH